MGMVYLKNKRNDETAAVVKNLTITRGLKELSQLSFDFDVGKQNQVAELMMIPFTKVTVSETNEQFIILNCANNPLGKINSYSVSAISVANELKYKYVDKKLQGSQSLETCLNLITSGTPFKYVIHDGFNHYGFSDGFGGDFADSLLMNTLADDFKFEYQFDNYTIHIYKKLGNPDSFLFASGADVKTIKRSEDYSNIATHIKGTGKQAEDGHYLASYEYTSPMAQQWGVIDAAPVSDERFTDNTALKNYIISQLQDYPLVQYTVDQIEFNQRSQIKNNVSIGNSGMLMDRFGTNVDVRIIGTVTHPQNPEIPDNITFGNYLFSATKNQLRQQAAFKRNASLGKDAVSKINGLSNSLNAGIWYDSE